MKRAIHVLLLCILLTIMPAYAYAQELVVTSTESDGTIYYQFGQGTFETNIEDGKTYELAYISYSSELQISVIKDGSPYAFDNGDVLFESGSYVMMVYELESSEYTTMTFFIENDVHINSNSSETQTGYNSSQDEDSVDYTSSPFYSDDIADDMDNVEALMDISGVISAVDFDNIDIKEMMPSYDAAEDMLLYQVDGKEILYSGIPNGSTVNGSVVVKPADGVSQFAYKDGEVIVTPDKNTYTEPGFYEIISLAYPDMDFSSASAGVQDISYMYETKFCFTIQSEDGACRLGVFALPEGFSYSSINYEDEPQDVPDSSYYYLEKDGHYHIIISCNTDNHLKFEYDYNKDTVAPFIQFNQDVSDGKGQAPVVYSCNETDAIVRTFIDGTEVNFPQNTEAYNGGYYRFLVSDTAGNQREYTFYVKAHYRFFSKDMIILLGVAVVLIVVYFYVTRHGEYKVDDRRDK